MNKTRHPGYYWVKVSEENSELLRQSRLLAKGNWLIALFDSELKFWRMTSKLFSGFDDSFFSEINETRIPSPDEVNKPQTLTSLSELARDCIDAEGGFDGIEFKELADKGYIVIDKDL